MNYDFSITVPASTSKINQYTQKCKLTYGVITRIIFTLPPGHQGLAHLQLLYHEFQLYPLNPAGDYHGAGVSIGFDERQALFVTPFELKARGWNTDETYAHEFIVNITMMRPEDVGWTDERVSAEAEAQAMLGRELEV
jgi:hypothetical protein